MAPDITEILLDRIDRLEAKVDALTNDMHELKGGKKAMLWVAGALGGLLALLGKWFFAKVGA